MHELSFSLVYRYDPGASGIRLPVTLSAFGTMVEVAAKLDTGSSACVFTRDIGEALGLEVELGEPQRFGTATGPFATFGHFVQIECLGLYWDALVYFAADPAFRRNVLGRQGWLERVQVALVDYERTLYLSPYGSE